MKKLIKVLRVTPVLSLSLVIFGLKGADSAMMYNS